MNTESRLYVDVHVLQTLPPSCVNRDDTGSPKTAIYGGVMRSRVSSQSWKRAMRLMFVDLLPSEQLGLRTLYIVRIVADEIKALIPEAEAEAMAQRVLEAAGLSLKDKGKDSEEKISKALFFMSRAQAKALAALAVEDEVFSSKGAPSKETKAKAAAALREAPGVDIALFGRMVADDPSLNTDACAQVAHSISTHKVSNEYDYFTAVDDLAPEDNAGAGHIGTVEYNSSTLYRYATVAVHALKTHLFEETALALRHFVHAFICAMPDGKQNTFANRTLPYAVLVTLRDDQPLNLAGAFERPVVSRDEGYAEASAKRLVAHTAKVYSDYANAPELSLTLGDALAGMGEALPLNKLLERLEAELNSRLGNGGN